MAYDPNNVFARILRREIPVEFLHEDDQCVAFRDAAPQAPLHLLVVPKRPLRSLGDAEPADAALLGHLLVTATAVAKQVDGGQPDCRIVINNGAGAGQSVFHLHVHVLAGRAFGWPPG